MEGSLRGGGEGGGNERETRGVRGQKLADDCSILIYVF